MMIEPSLITITGPTASGKTTIGRLLANELDYQFIEEEWSDNPYLEDFNNGKGSFFEAEIWFIERDFQRLQLALNRVQAGEGVVIDKPLYENYTYIEIAPMSSGEKQQCRDFLYQKSCELACPDLLIDIKANPDLILQRIAKRNRQMELSLTREWFELLAECHEKWRGFWPTMPTISLVAGDNDFLTEVVAIKSLVERIELHKQMI
jgi:deoxyadenosine/deoxycytidine kinase